MAEDPPSAAGSAAALPSGTVAFLYTDVEGSTRAWEASPDATRAAMARHDALLRDAVASRGGVVYRGQGDGLCAAFATASSAVAAALVGQRMLAEEPWQTPSPIRVRMALHAGAVEVQAGDYVGSCLNRVARLLGIGHGGQVLMTEVVAELAGDDLPEGVVLQDLGEHRLRDLIRPERVFQLLHPDLPVDYPPLKTLDVYPNNLPLQLTSFVGREREIAEVKRLVRSGRLVTLTAVGGCGKTRLSLQVAADLLDDFPDGVFLAELASVGEPGLVAVTVASAMGVHEVVRRSAEESLVRHLKSKRVLVLLDNCEHLIEECARLADSLLHACPSLQLLTTSREALGIPGEVSYRVPSLSLPDARHLPPPDQLSQYESVRLFLDRASSVNPSFHVSLSNAPYIAQITWRLDGIPLAIELAAAKTRLLTPEQIARRLDDQFRLLAGGSRTAMPRQQTLRAAIDWSYSLLSPLEQTLFRRLAVFQGGFSLEAAELVCSASPLGPFDVLELLSSLVDKSLVLVDQPEDSSEDRSGERAEITGDGSGDHSGERTGEGAEKTGEARYRLLETIRQYARDRLLEASEAQTTRDRHLSFFLDFAEAARTKLEGPQQGIWLEVLEAEFDNLRSALEWSRETTPGLGLRLVGSIWRFFQVRGYAAEGLHWLTEMLDLAPVRTRARADALIGAGILVDAVGDLSRKEEFLEESLAIYREVGYRRGVASALENLGILAASRGDVSAAEALLEESLAICDEIRDRVARGWVRRALADLAMAQADYSRAEALFLESLAAFRAAGDRWSVAVCLVTLGGLARSTGRESLSRACFEESVRLFRETGSRRSQASSLGLLGLLDYSVGNLRQARSDIEASLAIYADVDASDGVAISLVCLAWVARAEDARDEAAELLARALSLMRSTVTGDGSLVAAAQALAVPLVADLGDPREAAALARESLSFFALAHYRPGIAHCLGLLGALAAERGDSSDGVAMLAAASELDPTLGSPAFRDLGDERERALAKARAALGESTYAQAWAAGQKMSLDDAIADAQSETPDA